MTDTKAPRVKRKLPLDPESESWHKLPWRTFEQHVYRIQKRIFRAEQGVTTFFPPIRTNLRTQCPVRRATGEELG
jgi:hypothetical protein